MIQHKKGDKEAAHKSLERGIQRMEERQKRPDATPAGTVGMPPPGWQQRLIDQTLRREAEDILRT